MTTTTVLRCDFCTIEQAPQNEKKRGWGVLKMWSGETYDVCFKCIGRLRGPQRVAS